MKKYEMNEEERKVWKQLQSEIKLLCQDIEDSYSDCIENHIDPDLKNQSVGYSEKDGYFDLADEEQFFTHDSMDMKIHIMKNIYYQIGSQIELIGRKENRQDWQYFKDSSTNWEGNAFKGNIPFKYHGLYDPRKYVYEFVISHLYSHFDKEYVESIEKEYTDYLNYWFNDIHWAYRNGSFKEMSSSVDKRIKR